MKIKTKRVRKKIEPIKVYTTISESELEKYKTEVEIKSKR